MVLLVFYHAAAAVVDNKIFWALSLAAAEKVGRCGCATQANKASLLPASAEDQLVALSHMSII